MAAALILAAGFWRLREGQAQASGPPAAPQAAEGTFAFLESPAQRGRWLPKSRNPLR
jgi:hypothetical protein